MTTAAAPAVQKRPEPAARETALDNTTSVETPERVAFRYLVAGPARRYLAYLLDALIRLAIAVAVAVVTALAGGGDASLSGLGQGLMLVLLFLLEWGYYVLFETLSGGRTPGKRALGLRVVKEGGQPLSFIDSVLRNLLRAADFLPVGYVMGVLAMVTDRRFRRLGDRVAGTMVVIEEPVRVLPPFVLDPPARPDELDAFPGRPPLSSHERESIERFLRREALSPARREELADMIAPHLARRMALPTAPLVGGNSVRFLGLLHVRLQPGRAPRGGSPAGRGSP